MKEINLPLALPNYKKKERKFNMDKLMMRTERKDFVEQRMRFNAIIDVLCKPVNAHTVLRVH
jgi:hypothetical protein